MSAEKSLDRKLAALRANSASREFILADAKDADMAWGVRSAGPVWPRAANGMESFATKAAYLEQMRELVRQGAIDILLASVSSMSALAHSENLFADSAVTPAIRANDTTDIWLPRGGSYHTQPSRPFSTCDLEEAQFGKIGAAKRAADVRVNLGLYSITFNNDVERDRDSLLAFKAFRHAAAESGFRYFLEVFPPNAAPGLTGENVPAFVNDSIARTLAGISQVHRPEFLKIPYFGARWLEELVQYDTSVIVGVLGGASGTSRDAFQLITDVKKHGARLALLGRRIKDAEHPLTFVSYLRRVADEELTPPEAVRAYHADLERLKIPAKRDLTRDAEITMPELR